MTAPGTTVIDVVPDFVSDNAVIVDAPGATAVTSPLFDTVAADCVPLLQFIVRPVNSFPPASRVVAASCFVSPITSFAVDGDTDTDATGACVTLNVAGCDAPPPGDGFVTVTCAVLAAAMSDAAIDAVSRVRETKFVVRSCPLHLIFASEAKPVPSTVSINSEPPAALDEGVSVVIDGTGF
jgi:hypothetical protein